MNGLGSGSDLGFGFDWEFLEVEVAIEGGLFNLK